MSIPITNSTEKLAVDANSLSDLKQATTQNTPGAIKETAKQFEALFVGMMLKSMRKATPQDGPMDSEQGKMFTSMLDEQLSQKVATRGLGLADMLEKQMMSNVSECMLMRLEWCGAYVYIEMLCVSLNFIVLI